MGYRLIKIEDTKNQQIYIKRKFTNKNKFSYFFSIINNNIKNFSIIFIKNLAKGNNIWSKSVN